MSFNLVRILISGSQQLKCPFKKTTPVGKLGGYYVSLS